MCPSSQMGVAGGFPLASFRPSPTPAAHFLLHPHPFISLPWPRPRSHTHINDEEVQPAPGVGEVLLEAVRHPLEQHLQHEDVGEHLVGVLQQDLDGLPLIQVDVLEGLQRGGQGWPGGPAPRGWQPPLRGGLWRGFKTVLLRHEAGEAEWLLGKGLPSWA